MVFLVPPIQSPDENSHFTRVVLLSRGEVFPVQQDGKWGQMAPASLVQYVDAHMTMVGKVAERYSYQRWVLDAVQPAVIEPLAFRRYSAQSASPLVYLPQLAGLFVGKAIYALMPFSGQTYNWAAQLYFSRLGNLFAFAILSALAIAWLTHARAVSTGILLLPMTIHLAASCSYDVTPLLATLWLLVVVIGVLSRGGAPTRPEVILLALIAFLLGHAKVVYAPLLLVIIALKRDMAWRDFIILCGGLFLVCLGGAISGALLFGLPDDEALRAASSAQAGYLAANPLSVPGLILRSLMTNGGFYFASFLGNLGWLDTLFPLPALAFLFGLLILAFVHDALRGPSPLGWLGAAGILLGAALSIVGVMLSMYVYWTSHTRGIGAAVIDGVQGRYFLPLAFFVAAAISATPSRIAKLAGGWHVNMLMFQLAGQTALLGLTFFVVLMRYWISLTL